MHGRNESLLQPLVHLLEGRQYSFRSERAANHGMAMDSLLSRVFDELGYDVAFNVNVDDYYAPTRFAGQVQEVAGGADLVSSFFVRIAESGEGPAARDELLRSSALPTYMTGRELLALEDAADAGGPALREAALTQLRLHHNVARPAPQRARPHSEARSLGKAHASPCWQVLCHPGVAYTRTFWTSHASLRCAWGGAAGSKEAARHALERVQWSGGDDVCALRAGAEDGAEDAWDAARPLRYRPHVGARQAPAARRAPPAGPNRAGPPRRQELPAEDLRLWQRAALMACVNVSIIPQARPCPSFPCAPPTRPSARALPAAGAERGCPLAGPRLLPRALSADQHDGARAPKGVPRPARARALTRLAPAALRVEGGRRAPGGGGDSGELRRHAAPSQGCG
jgi:hypothetical protein